MEFRTSQKDNGSVENAPFLPINPSSVLSLRHTRHCTDGEFQSCVLCPNSYGAFKQTTTAQWAHLLCAIWVPDTGVSNTVYMEPIDGVENISRNRWKLVRLSFSFRTVADEKGRSAISVVSELELVSSVRTRLASRRFM